MQQNLYDQALAFQKTHTRYFDYLNEFKDFFAGENPGGFAVVFSSDDESIEPLLKEYKISARCIPLDTFARTRDLSIYRQTRRQKNYLRQGLLRPQW